MKIDFANLQYQYQLYKKEIDAAIQSVLDKSNYIMGDEVNLLERQLECFTSAKHVITCSNGTDALTLAMKALDIGIGDEVITTPFTFIATAETIAMLGAIPVFVDVEPDTFNIDTTKIASAITSRTKAIMPVSLYGQPSNMLEINNIAKSHGLKVIIDGAQCFGSTYHGESTAKFADIYTTSFFPAKPLGCYGDGGAIFTDNDTYAEKIRMLRVHGQNERYHHKYIGMTGRLDTIQAAVLLAKLPHHKEEILARDNVAQLYSKGLKNIVKTPVVRSDRKSAWAQYTIRVNNRSEFQEHLLSKNIPTSIHYPKPLHLQECFHYLNLSSGMFPISEMLSKEVISLPMNPFLKTEEIDYIVDAVTSFCNVDN
jgi:UDP-2-acetamido-2-deoxy-ribo-hexuluronate aminotransferase